ncbi:MAG: hypothetical protein OHK0015_52200 [Chloroflexi bacterium OHK40]
MDPEEELVAVGPIAAMEAPLELLVAVLHKDAGAGHGGPQLAPADPAVATELRAAFEALGLREERNFV